MKPRRIMLIEPPATIAWSGPSGQRIPVVPPLGISSVGAVLEQQGFDVRLVDGLAEGFSNPLRLGDGTVRVGLSDAEISDRIADFDPEVVGVSCVLSNRHRDARTVCSIAKSAAPSALVVMGGAHPTVLPELVMEDPNLDIAVLGEGDLALPEILARLDEGATLSDFDGVAYREDGQLRIQPKTTFIEDLDALPFPARHLLPMQTYWDIGQPHGDLQRTPFATMITSRGCPGRCIFCSAERLWGRRYRLRSADNVLTEMESLVEQFGIKEIHFEDDNLTASKRRTIELFSGMVDRGLDLTWSTPNGLMIETLDEEVIDLMAASGCFAASLAVESGSQRVLTEVVHKRLDLSHVKSVVRLLRARGIHTRGFFVIGFPGETRDEIFETIAFAREAGFDWATLQIATPLPGTEMHRICVERGYLVDDLDLRNLRYSIGSIVTDEFDPAFLEEQWARADEEINYVGNANMREGNWEAAIADFERVARLYPDHRLVFGYLGLAYEKLGRLQAAREAYARALELDPQNALAADGLGRVGADRN